MLTDSPEAITKKIRSAVTDSIHGITFDPPARPGVSNLLTILADFQSPSNISDTKGSISSSREDVDTLATKYSDKGTSDLKRDVAEAVIEGWRFPRDELARLRGDRGYLIQVLEDGNRRARDLSNVTLTRVKQLIGLSDAVKSLG